MKKLILFSVLISVFAQAQASDHSFKRLERQYKKSPDKCLQQSKELIKKHPERASSYYFATIIFLDKAASAKNSRGLYLHLNSSLRYAKGFETYADDEFKDELSWSDVLERVREECAKLMQGKLKLDDEQLLEKLRLRLIEIPGLEDLVTVEIETNEQKAQSDLSELTPAVIRSNSKHLYGMPEGTETVFPYDEGKERALLVMINKERLKKGMDTLIWQADLSRAARYHAYDLATQNYFEHHTYDRSAGELVHVGKTFDRVRRFYTKSHVNSENIAAGNQEVEATYQQWYTSAGHYKNMFNPESRYAGIGLMYDPDSDHKYYWVFCSAE